MEAAKTATNDPRISGKRSGATFGPSQSSFFVTAAANMISDANAVADPIKTTTLSAMIVDRSSVTGSYQNQYDICRAG